jgi:hypothetical protein
MITSRALWLSLMFGIMITGALTACVTRDEQPAVEAQCYWLSNEGAGWVARPDLAEAELCFEMDSCSGGVGLSGGGCYKWAVASNASATPWSDLGFQTLAREDPAATTEAAGPACYVQDGATWSAYTWINREAQCFLRDRCSGGAGDDQERRCYKWAMSAEAPALRWSRTLTHPRLAEDVPPPDEIYDGSYEMTSDCPEQGCSYGPAQFSANTPLYADQNARSRVIATIPPSECALKTGSDGLRSAPQRGVVLETNERFVAGDVIYLTNYEGEGYSTIWRRGEYISDFQDEVAVRWDDDPDDPREGYWVEVRRANGQLGWVRNPEIGSACDFAGR